MNEHIIELRPHQTKGIKLCRRAYRAGRSRVLAVAPTGAGKTILFCWIAASAVQRGGRVLVVVHRRELLGQTVKKMRDAGIDRVGVVQSGEQRDPDAPVQVASVQTLLARVASSARSMFGESGLPTATLLVLDECLPGSTLVGGRPICSLSEGDVVPSWNHERVMLEGRRVTHVFRNRPTSLMRVRTSRGTLVCTPNHPCFSPLRGYVMAKDLSVGEAIAGVFDSDVSHVRPAVLDVARVERLEVLEPGIDGTFDGVCRDGLVYNLEVDGNHNYFADSFLVHNCHHYVADKWAAVVAHYKAAKILGVTATPERGDGAPMGDMFETLLVLSSVRELTEAGYLVPCDVIAPPAKRRTNCEDPVDAYRRLAPGRKAVVFAASVKEAYALAGRYTRAGFPAVCIEGDMASDDRDSALARFAAGELVVIVNVSCLAEGWDCPSAEVCILARGCSHVGTYLQMVGRVLRCHPGKARALLIDLRGVVHKHGLPSADRMYSLDGKAISGDGEAPKKTCKACEVLSPIVARVCAACGVEFPPPPPEVSMKLSRVELAAVESTYFHEEFDAAVRRGSVKPAGYAAHRFVKKFGRFPAKFWREHGGPEERARSMVEAS